MPDDSSPGSKRAGGVLLGSLMWAWIVVLALTATLAVYATLNFTDHARDLPEYKQSDVPHFRHRTSVATLASLLTLSIVLLRQLQVVGFLPRWIVVTASILATGFSLAYLFSVAGLRT